MIDLRAKQVLAITLLKAPHKGDFLEDIATLGIAFAAVTVTVAVALSIVFVRSFVCLFICLLAAWQFVCSVIRFIVPAQGC